MDLGFDKCILCMRSEALTDEHVLPASLGGSLKLKLLCAGCNNGIGAELVAGLMRDPSIRLAVEAVRPEVPEFVQSLGSEQVYFARTTDNQILRVSKKGDSERVLPSHNDGELVIQDPREIPRNILGRMKKKRLPEVRIQEALKQYEAAGTNEPVIIPEIGLVTFKREMPGAFSIDLGYNAKQLDQRLVVLMAYEFLAAMIGTEVYGDEFGPIRRHILENLVTDAVDVEAHLVRVTEPWHYIHLQPIPDGGVQVDVAFFRTSVYRVKLTGIASVDAHMVYEQDLKAKTAVWGTRGCSEEPWETLWSRTDGDSGAE